MGLTIAVVDEKGAVQGEPVTDPGNVLHPLLQSAQERSDSVLGGIDWYGDTMFNHLQIRRFLEEWKALSARVRTESDRVIFSEVENLAQQCENGNHLYLKFIGD